MALFKQERSCSPAARSSRLFQLQWCPCGRAIPVKVIRSPRSKVGCLASAGLAQVRDVPNAAFMEVIGDYERRMRDGDAAALERAFAPRGQYVFRRRVDGTPTIGAQALEELTSAWASEPDAEAYRGARDQLKRF